MRILQPRPEKQYYQKRKKDIYHGRRFMVVINTEGCHGSHNLLKLVSMEKKMEILCYIGAD